MPILFENVRLSFPRIIQPEVNKSFPDSPAKYSANLIIRPNHPMMATFMAEVGKLATEKWKEHAGRVLEMAQANKKLRNYGRGEEIVKSQTYEVYEGYEGMLYISASSDKDHPPQIVKRNAMGVPEAAQGIERQDLARKLYGGCYVHALISPWLQDNAGGRAVRVNLLALDFASEGDPLGDNSAVDIASAFAGVTPAAAATPAASAFPSFFGLPQQ